MRLPQYHKEGNMTDELAVLLQAATKRNISSQSTGIAAGMTDRVQSMEALKGLGFSLQDIGTFYGLTRQRVQQLIGDSRRAEPVNREKIDAETLMMEIWTEANEDLSWWGTNGRLIKTRIVSKFLDQDYTYERARSLARTVGISKLDVILRVTFQLGSTHEAKVAWFYEMIKLYSKAEILEAINGSQLLTIPRYTFIRVWRELGLKVVHRKSKATI